MELQLHLNTDVAVKTSLEERKFTEKTVFSLLPHGRISLLQGLK